jgi:hypothetical protein
VVRVALVVYLAAYYVLLALAVVTLWQSGLIDELHQGWTLVAIAVALALGAVLAVASRDRGERADAR